MENQHEEGTLTRGADGGLYLLSPGRCVRVECEQEASGKTQLGPCDSAEFKKQEAAGQHSNSEEHLSARMLIEPGDQGSARMLIDPGDQLSARMLIEPGDQASARMLIEPGDQASARMLIDPGDHASARMLIESDDSLMN